MSTSLCSAVTYSTGLRECRVRGREKLYPVSFPVLPSGVFLTLFMICLHASQYPLTAAFRLDSVSLSTCLSCWCSLYLPVCLSLSVLPVSLHFLSNTLCPRPAVGNNRAHRGPKWVYLLPLFSRWHARCRLSLYAHFWPHGQEGMFSVALGLHVQKPFPSPCLSVLRVWQKLQPLFSSPKC